MTNTNLLQRALAITDSYVEPIIELTTKLTQVSAPSNDEGARAEVLRAELESRGYERVHVDEIADVTARIPGKDRSRSLLIAAHIDTVFPHGTDLTVTRETDTLHAPGVGDNTVAVATVAHLKQVLEELGEVPAIDLVITGNVGEEGLGDLRGMKAVVSATEDIVGAIAVEGQALGSVTYEAVGSKRYRVTVTGKGGHSWGQAGTPSAIHHLARLIARMDEIPLLTEPKTSFNAGVVNGGISVNTIAPEATAILDMRSTSAEALAALVTQVDAVLDSPCPEGIAVQVEVVGDRPAGSQSADMPLKMIADEVLAELGLSVRHEPGSTDANVPIARGIPSICIGVTTGNYAHREDEYINLGPISMGFAHLITVILKSAEALA
ncbi:MAG: M20/M25/M40 family metallo-hydrolase [Thermomicrobiales bacterium]|nr:M20/M25/M40 family metallo-hydrolase [Thermomicrobiales bacterium]MCO5228902.1 M20/M25/M40 family metallo-hydrolase [Thermomicrobiales bacterium]